MLDSGKGSLFCSPGEKKNSIKQGFCSTVSPRWWIFKSWLLLFSPSCQAFSWVLHTPAPQAAIWDVWRSCHQLAPGPVDVPCISPGPASPHYLALQHWPVCAPTRQRCGGNTREKPQDRKYRWTIKWGYDDTQNDKYTWIYVKLAEKRRTKMKLNPIVFFPTQINIDMSLIPTWSSVWLTWISQAVTRLWM